MGWCATFATTEMSEPASSDIHIAAFFLVAVGVALVIFSTDEVRKFRDFERAHPYTMLARKLNSAPNREWCDDNEAAHRLYVSGVVDRFTPEIRALWKERNGGNEPTFSLLNLGVAQLRVNPKAAPGQGFDSSAWSWDEAYGLIQRTQSEPDAPDNIDRWRDVDSMVRFLIEKDYSRLVYGKKFKEPELTEHQFRPNPGVVRVSEHEFTVQLNPGDFKGFENVLGRVLEQEWQGNGFHVRIQWMEGKGAYKLRAHFDSNRSYVNHRTRTLEIANLAWTKTVAHELGHVLGFDDHYYNVWNSRNCYYSQESRLSDLMSNSEHGAVNSRHWEILNDAYPWQKEPRKGLFNYFYGK
jgi:hypothetical protein